MNSEITVPYLQHSWETWSWGFVGLASSVHSVTLWVNPYISTVVDVPIHLSQFESVMGLCLKHSSYMNRFPNGDFNTKE